MKMKIFFAIPMSYDWRYVDWRLRKLLWEEIESITQYKQRDIRIIIVFGRSKHYAACELNKLKACRWTKEFTETFLRFVMMKFVIIDANFFFHSMTLPVREGRDADKKINHHIVLWKKNLNLSWWHDNIARHAGLSIGRVKFAKR